MISNTGSSSPLDGLLNRSSSKRGICGRRCRLKRHRIPSWSSGAGLYVFATSIRPCCTIEQRNFTTYLWVAPRIDSRVQLRLFRCRFAASSRHAGIKTRPRRLESNQPQSWVDSSGLTAGRLPAIFSSRQTSLSEWQHKPSLAASGICLDDLGVRSLGRLRRSLRPGDGDFVMSD